MKTKYQLPRLVHPDTLSKLIKQESLIQNNVDNGFLHRKRNKTVLNKSLEESLVNWIWDIFERKVFVSDALMQEKAENIQSMMNYHLSHENQLHLRFSNRWLYKFKKRNKFKMYR